MFKEVPSIDGAHMTIYELPDGDDVKDLDARVQPALDKLPGDTRIDTRCYREFASWTGEEWRGGKRSRLSDPDMEILLTRRCSSSRYSDVDRGPLATRRSRT